MSIWLVGFKCATKAANMGCECNLDVLEETKEKFERDHGFEYDDYCMYYLIQAENEADLTLDYCLHQQGATEYETAKEIWVERDVIWNTSDDTYNKEPRVIGEYEGRIRKLSIDGGDFSLKVEYDNREASGLVEINGHATVDEYGTEPDELNVTLWANGLIKGQMHLKGSYNGLPSSGINAKGTYFTIEQFNGTGRFDVEYKVDIDITDTTAKITIEKAAEKEAA